MGIEEQAFLATAQGLSWTMLKTKVGALNANDKDKTILYNNVLYKVELNRNEICVNIKRIK